MAFILRNATVHDAEVLAHMNKCLIEDEGSRNPMNVSQLRDRMIGFLNDSWRVDLFFNDDQVVGYALYQFRRDDYDSSLPVVYLRQFFVEREHRRKGYGQQALLLLRQQRFGRDATVEIDVLALNSRGEYFWTAVGFKPYCINMKLPPE